MIWLALAAQLSLPAGTRDPHGLVGIFSVDDFPPYLISGGVSRTVYTRVTVKPDGVIQSCAAEASSGDSVLDDYTCGLILRRAKFTPASWTDGKAVYGVLRTPVSWRIENSPTGYEESLKTNIPDLTLFVRRLPKGARSIAAVSLKVAADERGQPRACAGNPPSDKAGLRRYFPQLVPIACKQVMSQLKLSPVIDASGKPTRSVQMVSAHFRVQR